MPEMRKTEVLGELDPLIGRTISGRYRVHSLLGQGGMGKVFQAQQIPLGRAVALKVLSTEYRGDEDPEFQKRFYHEAAILARLKSPHTVTVFDYGRDGDVFYIAMELLAGDSLGRVIDLEGPMQPERVIAITDQVCRSLREAHALGVIHRDLKPGNVLIMRSEDGEEIAKVLDFGLAKSGTLGEDTNPNLVPGSPKYMPPEAIRQEPVDARADIYSLGVMMYQMLTGLVPFDRPNPMDILLAHVHEAPPTMKARNPNVPVPPSLEALVMRCLAKYPAERFASMQEVLDGLRAVTLADGGHPVLRSQRPFAPPAQSGAAASRPAAVSEPPKLRLRATDVTPGGTRRSGRLGLVKGFLLVAFLGLAGVVGAYSLGVGGVQQEGQPVAAASPPEPPPAPAQTEPTEAEAEPAETGEPPAEADMVFSEDELKQRPKGRSAQNRPRLPIALTVKSDPAGAEVWLRGEQVGTTPLTLELTPLASERVLVLRLQKDGFETFHVRSPFRPGTMSVDVDLIPSPVRARLLGEPDEQALAPDREALDDALEEIEAEAEDDDEGAGADRAETEKDERSSLQPNPYQADSNKTRAIPQTSPQREGTPGRRPATAESDTPQLRITPAPTK